jgi:hypothetical protein
MTQANPAPASPYVRTASLAGALTEFVPKVRRLRARDPRCRQAVSLGLLRRGEKAWLIEDWRRRIEALAAGG